MMLTFVYWPNDPFVSEQGCLYLWTHRDLTTRYNNFAANEGPSYCVRLLVFDYDDCL